jgi:hypothetical protein
MKFKTIDLSDEQAMKTWDGFVVSHPLATPSHLSCWLAAIYKTYSFEPLLYVATNDEGGIAGIFPLFKIKSAFTGSRAVSLPFSDYGGPLCTSAETEAEMVRFVKHEHQHKVNYLEIRGTLQNSDGFVPYSYYKRHVLDLQKGLPEIQKSIDKKTIMYSVRKAEKAGVSIRQENTPFGLNEFYRLNNLTRRKHGVPCQPRAFFENLFSCIIGGNKGMILLALHDSDVIAASLFLTVAKKIHYKYNASDPVLLKKYSPNHLLTWHIISWGVEHGFESLDFGRTSPDNEGLIRYKNMWGMTDGDLPYYYYPRVKGAVSTKESGLRYRCMTALWRHLPLGIMEKLSTVLFRHLG